MLRQDDDASCFCKYITICQAQMRHRRINNLLIQIKYHRLWLDMQSDLLRDWYSHTAQLYSIRTYKMVKSDPIFCFKYVWFLECSRFEDIQGISLCLYCGHLFLRDLWLSIMHDSTLYSSIFLLRTYMSLLEYCH